MENEIVEQKRINPQEYFDVIKYKKTSHYR